MNRPLTIAESIEVSAIRERIAADIAAAMPIGTLTIVPTDKLTTFDAINDSVLGLLRFRVHIALWDRFTNGNPCEYWGVDSLYRECRTIKATGFGYSVDEALEAMGNHLKAQDAVYAASLAAVE